MVNNTITLLLVEDDQGDALLVQRLLDASPLESFSIEVVSTAAASAARLDQGGVDVVLLDLGLPDSDGFDTVFNLHESFPNVPVVVLTGLDDEEVGLQAIQCGAHDYVPKGMLDGQLLYRAIRFAVARQNRIKAFQEEAHTDSLTGMCNRRAFDAEIERRLAESKRYGRPLSIIVMDVDNFKTINDQHGHRAGDHVLYSIAQVIRNNLRKTDIPTRFGGDEFAVLLPDTQIADAELVMNRLVRTIADEQLLFEEREHVATVSAGVAQVSNNYDREVLIQQADTALYAAKKAGRNCGCVAGVGQGPVTESAACEI